ncbi:M20 family metallopeptidase [Aspergillus puulaauensis]|uniref:Peptidase M20 dimerisation domain-containing protein n=1 Tax=Aspergillus puulaauensis TaxID=1220207 RepID=A0A7R7XLY2_9EURO|nr:uncharacterized protein APUU_31219A [Aspergillus puulaauensis]BCS22994.1 hypothetical protein APUU_31219A [Aspergillus puulaauensis]
MSLNKPVITLHRDICSIESISGNEAEVAHFLVKYLESKGFEVEKQYLSSHPDPERFNVLAYLKGSRNTRVCLTSHIDVVPPYWPYTLKNNNTEIHGRGTVDAKACVAAMIIAAEELQAEKLLSPGDISLLFVIGEEVDGDGMLKANELGINWESVIFGEPTEGKLPKGHKGVLSVNIKATGKAAHSGYPELGDSATEKLLAGLEAIRHKLELPRSELLGETTMNIGRIDAGVAANVIPFHAEAQVLFRVASGTVEELQKKIQDTLHSTGYEFELAYKGNAAGPVTLDCDVPGFETMVVSYGTDVPGLKGNHKRYLWGPGTIHVAHTEAESLKVSELVDAVDAYRKLTLHALGK